jgi:hypothetical protein
VPQLIFQGLLSGWASPLQQNENTCSYWPYCALVTGITWTPLRVR